MNNKEELIKLIEEYVDTSVNDTRETSVYASSEAGFAKDKLMEFINKNIHD